MRRFTLPLLFLPVLLALSVPAFARIFDPESFTLDNGLQVVVVNNARAPIVTHMLWYKVGAADEPVGKSGVAHFLEHLMFKGTDKLAPGEFSRIVAANGGSENAFTSWDYTGYYQTVAKDRLEIMMRHEADRMANLKLVDAIVLPERDVVLEERRSRTDNEPGGRLSEMARASLFLHHPYGTPIIGWPQEVSALTTQDAIDFYRQWYAPNNAVLVISGDVTAQEVKPLAESTYGLVPRRDVPDRVRPSEPPQTAPRRVSLESEQVRQPSLSIEYLAPSYNRSTDEFAQADPYALEILSELLGGASSSRLYQRLVVDQGLAAGAGSWYDASDYDLSSFGLYISPRPGVDVEIAEEALRAEIATLLEGGVTPQEVSDAKQRLTAAAIFARDDLSTAPRAIGQALVTGQTLDDIESWPERIEAVTPEQVEAAARAILKDNSSVTRLLLPKPTS
ncbi:MULTISPECIES: pitrilysin family protein [Limibacillus]|uniref:Zinc protease n=1 Tax=Limibacillus halophilus TaxID=1579333 RepID=A0A839SU65_9PROT|nr:pitrilysin family protein [Limibacillus halophilus]MBB3066032.1 zinc protease [Limibacillus halophilus]